MILWVDAQLSPHLAAWLTDGFSVQAFSVAHLGLRDAKDHEIYQAAREAEAVVVTKDRDFVFLQERLGPPPQILWLTLGNTSNAHLKKLFSTVLAQALELIQKGEPLVQIQDSKAVSERDTTE